MTKYKVIVKQGGMGWRLTLYKKYQWLFFYIPDTCCLIKRGYEYMVDTRINDWVDTFNIPHSMVKISKPIKEK